MFTRGLIVVVLAILISSLAACSGGSDDESATDGDVSMSSEPAPGEMVEEEAAMDRGGADDSAAASQPQVAQIQASDFNRRVIRSGDLELRVTDVEAAVRYARDAIADRGGHVASSTARSMGDDDARSDITFEVPSEEFDAIMGLLRDASQVVSVAHESTSSQDVTEEYVDLQSRLSNLESTEARFVELLEEAESISDVLSVENEISRIRGEIEQIQGRINYLDQRTSYSRIHVAYLLETDESVNVVGKHFTPGETARAAWDASMQFVGAIGNGVIAIAVFFWWGWPLLGLAVFGIIYYRRRRRVENAPA